MHPTRTAAAAVLLSLALTSLAAAQDTTKAEGLVLRDPLRGFSIPSRRVSSS